MTSTLSTRSPKPSSDEPDAQAGDKKPVLGLSIAQITGGALAAMTAAFLGSTLGTGGTILGAAFASIVAGVAGALYTASLRHTGKRVKSVFVPAEPTDASDPTGVLEPFDETQMLPRIEPDQTSTPTTSQLTVPQPAVSQPAKRRFALRAVFVTVAVFLLAGAGLTGYELLTGQAVSGGQGTTITQVSEPQGPAGQPEAEKSEAPAPSASATEEPTAPPSTTAPEPVPTTEQPTPGPATSSPTPSETPGTPGASAPTQ